MLTPRQIVTLSILVFAGATLQSPLFGEKPEENRRKPVKHLIDTHIHLYDTTREGGIPWPGKGDPVLYKPHLPADYTKIARAAGVTGVVIVEASHRFDDNQWILDLVEGDDFYLGFVGNIDLNREDFEERLLELKADPRFVGIRPRGGSGLDYADPHVLANLKIMAKHNVTLDYMNRGGVAGIETLDRIAREIPELHIVANHCLGHPFDGNTPAPEWIAAVGRAAQNKNIWVKISGLYQKELPEAVLQDTDRYTPVLDVLWDSFGNERVIYGSNWPVTKRAGSLEGSIALIDCIVSEKGQQARERYYWKNAAEAYRLSLK